MKPSTLILSLSLAANLGLLVLFLASPRPTARSAVAVTSADSSRRLPESTIGSGHLVLSGATTRPTPAPSLWAELATDDLDALATRLKAAGFTYRQTRAIVLALATKRFSSARAALRGKDDQPYWKPLYYFENENPEMRAKEMQISRQESAFFLKYYNSPEAIGEDEEEADAMRQRYGDLPLEKLQRLARIQGDYEELLQKVTRTTRALTPADRKELNLLAGERERDIQQMLTPDEFDEYILRESPTAQSLRNNLGLLRLTENEYKVLFSIQRSIDQQFSPLDRDENTVKARAEAVKNVQPQIAAALGADRYADYKQLVESGSDKVTRLMARLDLPLSNVGKINNIRDDITQRATAIRRDSAVSPSDRTARLVTLAQEAEAKLTTSLGGRVGYEAYADMKGDWLRNLTKP